MARVTTPTLDEMESEHNRLIEEAAALIAEAERRRTRAAAIRLLIEEAISTAARNIVAKRDGVTCAL